jgi:hypothetical protein
LTVCSESVKANAAVLIVDSITHVWRELGESYRKRKNVARLDFQHWNDIKNEWAKWTRFYLNAPIHIFVLGRAGYDYDYEVNEETNRKELVKTNTKMKAEGEFGYEPSLLIEMERVLRGPEVGAGYFHRAHVVKDRTDTINGKSFDFAKPNDTYRPGDWQTTFAPFDPVFKALNIGGEHVGVDADRTSEDLFAPNSNTGQAARVARLRIALETVENTLVLIWPGQDAKSKACKLAAIEAVFGVRSWTAVERMLVEELEAGVEVMRGIETACKARPVDDANELAALATMVRDRIEEQRKATQLAPTVTEEEAVL